jgi:transposase
MKKRSTEREREVCGLDLGDRYSRLCLLDGETGEVVEEGRIATTDAALRRRFSSAAPMRVALEVGTHSPWVSRVLSECGHEVIVANPRKLRLIYTNRRKNDAVDAMYLARLARTDPALLAPVHHRGQGAQRDLAILRSREALVRARTQLVNHVRGAVKSIGARLPRCGAEAFARKAGTALPPGLVTALTPVIGVIASLTAQIRSCDRTLAGLAKTYPETAVLRQVKGVGPITSLAYVLTLESPERFATSRAVGPYLGLIPAQHDSGDSTPQMRISKEGDSFVRKLLVGSAQYILGPFGEDCDLRRHGLRLGAGGSRKDKKRAVVAVARKLAVLLHCLWKTQTPYDPLYNAARAQRATAAA